MSRAAKYDTAAFTFRKWWIKCAGCIGTALGFEPLLDSSSKECLCRCWTPSAEFLNISALHPVLAVNWFLLSSCSCSQPRLPAEQSCCSMQTWRSGGHLAIPFVGGSASLLGGRRVPCAERRWRGLCLGESHCLVHSKWCLLLYNSSEGVAVASLSKKATVHACLLSIFPIR